MESLTPSGKPQSGPVSCPAAFSRQQLPPQPAPALVKVLGLHQARECLCSCQLECTQQHEGLVGNKGATGPLTPDLPPTLMHDPAQVDTVVDAMLPELLSPESR